MQDFAEFMMASHMMEVPSCGVFYSWNNKGLGNARICSRIGKAVMNDSMLDVFRELMVKYQPCGVTDHTPLVVTFQNEVQERGRPFEFLNILAEDKRFFDVVSEAWRSVYDRHYMKRVWKGLQAVKKALKNLQPTHYPNAHIKEKSIKVMPQNLQKNMALNTDPQLPRKERVS